MNGRRAISPRRTRSGLLICNEDQEQGVPALTTNQRQRPVVPRSPAARRTFPAVVRRTTQRPEAVSTIVSGFLEGTVELPPLIDLTQDVEVTDDVVSDEGNGGQDLLLHIEAARQRIMAGMRAATDYLTQLRRDPVTPQSRSPLDTTIDLTGSPNTPAPVAIQNNASPSCSTVPASTSSPSLSGIQCPVCMESYTAIMIKGYHFVSTTCGHVFCSHCLPECVELHGRCPNCRQRLSSSDYHQLFFN